MDEHGAYYGYSVKLVAGLVAGLIVNCKVSVTG